MANDLINRILHIIHEKLRKINIYFNIDWTTPEERNVSEWLKNALKNDSDMLRDVLLENNLIVPDTDATVIRILRWVHDNVSYVSDIKQYRTTEYWATPSETLKNGLGDCEDGAVLIYCLCRVAGISNEQVQIIAGGVKSGTGLGGHCWVRYTSINYPYVIYYIDWCYWYDSSIISKREAYQEYKDSIILPTYTNYKKIWFIANDESGFKRGEM